MTLLRSFAKNSIEKNDRIFLMLVFLYSPERPDKNNNNDFFKDVKQLALQISKKYKVMFGQHSVFCIIICLVCTVEGSDEIFQSSVVVFYADEGNPFSYLHYF